VVEKWKECTRCGLHETRRNVVLGRGSMPADILIIGEAPGKVEDLQGQPIVGPSGRLLDYIMETAAEQAEVEVPSCYITNTCACRPTDSLGGPNTQPTDAQIWACFERLMDEAKKIKPIRVILVGKIAQKNCSQAFKGAHHMHHPAFLLRSGGPKSPYFAKTVRDLSVVFKEVASVKEEGSKKEGNEKEGNEKKARRKRRRSASI